MFESFDIIRGDTLTFIINLISENVDLGGGKIKLTVKRKFLGNSNDDDAIFSKESEILPSGTKSVTFFIEKPLIDKLQAYKTYAFDIQFIREVDLVTFYIGILSVYPDVTQAAETSDTGSPLFSRVIQIDIYPGEKTVAKPCDLRLDLVDGGIWP